MDKKDIVDKCKLGDAKAREWMYKTHSSWMLGICRRYFSDRMVAEDLVHDSFVNIFEKIEQLKENSALEGWMKRIVVNNCLMALKKQQNIFNIDEINELEIENPSNNELQNNKERFLQADIPPEVILSIIDGLPAGYRTVFNLYVFEKYKHNQISDELGISEGTSKSQLLRARKLIQHHISKWMEENDKRKDKKKAVVYSMLLIMNDDLDYIDQIVFEKLNRYRIPMVSQPPVFVGSGFSGIQPGFFSVIKNFVGTAFGKMALYSLSLMVGTFTIYLLFIHKNKPSPNPQEKLQFQSTISSDTIIRMDTPKTNVLFNAEVNQKEDTENQTVVPNQNTSNKHETPTVKKTVYDTVVVKNVIKIKKKKVVTRMIEKTDTLPQ